MMAGSGFMYVILPRGCNELGIGAGIQGFSHWMSSSARPLTLTPLPRPSTIIEGYLRYDQEALESPLAEKANQQGVYHFTPEMVMGISGRRIGPISSR